MIANEILENWDNKKLSDVVTNLVDLPRNQKTDLRDFMMGYADKTLDMALCSEHGERAKRSFKMTKRFIDKTLPWSILLEDIDDYLQEEGLSLEKMQLMTPEEVYEKVSKMCPVVEIAINCHYVAAQCEDPIGDQYLRSALADLFNSAVTVRAIYALETVRAMKSKIIGKEPAELEPLSKERFNEVADYAADLLKSEIKSFLENLRL